jgi:hypothetical protein
MRGFGLIIGYIIGNKQARDWVIHKICQTSCIIEDEFRKTPLGQIFTKEKEDDDVSETD